MSEKKAVLSGDVLLDIIRKRKIGDKTECDWHDDRSINANMVREFAEAGRDWFKELDAALAANKKVDLKGRKEALRVKNLDVLEEVFKDGTREEKLKALAYSTKLDQSFNTKTDITADVAVKVKYSDEDIKRKLMFHMAKKVAENKETDDVDSNQ